MYGLVNSAIKSLVSKEFGEEVWSDIVERAGINEHEFIDMQSYPDDVTYSLIHVASEVLNIPKNNILKTFGEYWLVYTGEVGYAGLLDMVGSNLDDFLSNLDTIHASVEVSFTELKPPIFGVNRLSKNQWDVRYFSEREGLGAMLEGLIVGLAKRFKEEITIESLPTAGNEKNRFLVTRL